MTYLNTLSNTTNQIESDEMQGRRIQRCIEESLLVCYFYFLLDHANTSASTVGSHTTGELEARAHNS